LIPSCHESLTQNIQNGEGSVLLNLRVNGQWRTLPVTAESPPLGVVLTVLAVRKELVAIALNDMIVPRAQWDQTLVSEGDRLEVVHFVGGGCFSETPPGVVGQRIELDGKTRVGNGMSASIAVTVS
jgi:sulfur carrier protein